MVFMNLWKFPANYLRVDVFRTCPITIRLLAATVLAAKNNILLLAGQPGYCGIKASFWPLRTAERGEAGSLFGDAVPTPHSISDKRDLPLLRPSAVSAEGQERGELALGKTGTCAVQRRTVRVPQVKGLGRRGGILSGIFPCGIGRLQIWTLFSFSLQSLLLCILAIHNSIVCGSGFILVFTLFFLSFSYKATWVQMLLQVKRWVTALKEQ